MATSRAGFDIALSDIRGLAASYRRRELSPVEAVEVCFDRIDRCDDRLNAWITVLREQAVSEAKDAERDLGRGDERGPLHGVPIAVKDNIDVSGVRTTCASPILREQAVAVADATATRRLREGGAIVLGKTNLLEFAYGIVHPEYGQCNNPWNLERTSGGSSSGSVAAVAAGMAYGSVGTDTGGSIRIPAAYCGVVGLKPTYDRVSRTGVFPLSESLDHVGPIGRTVADVRLLLQVMGEGKRDVVRKRRAKAPNLAGRRAGIVREHLGGDLLPGVRAAFDRAAEVIEEAGARVVEVSVPSLRDADQALLDVIAPEATLVHEEWLKSRPGDYAPMTLEQLELGSRTSALAYLRGQECRRRIRSEFDAVLGDVEVVISPAVAWVAPREDPAVAGDEGAIEARRSGPYNLCGLPAVTVPCGFAEDELPVGLQIAAGWMKDFELLDFAEAFEERSGWRSVCPAGIVSLIGGPA
jgi:aspartyl-tRNA(Asn)/glutamyl-tRNA(Gln) amidotransferase subunit A